MLRHPKRTAIFSSDSLRESDVESLPNVHWFPPVQRGDVEKLTNSDNSPWSILILDGLFGETLAVSPRECVTAIENGHSLFGASSMGALRAADLWPRGFVGIGEVYLAARTQLIRSEDDVAVCYEPIQMTAITVSLVHLRRVLSMLVRTSSRDHALIDTLTASHILSCVQKLHYTDRTVEAIEQLLSSELRLEEILVSDIARLLKSRRTNPKFLDAHLAYSVVLGRLWVENPVLLSSKYELREQETSFKPRTARTCEVCSSKLDDDYIFCPVCCNLCHEQ